MAKEKAKKDEPKFIECDYKSHTPCHFSFEGKEFNLHHNQSYSLPDCRMVQSLIAQGRLTVKK